MVWLYNIGIGWYVCQISMISVHTSMLHRSVKRATPSCFDEKLHSVETGWGQGGVGSQISMNLIPFSQISMFLSTFSQISIKNHFLNSQKDLLTTPNL